jgi:hypothetical protein
VNRLLKPVRLAIVAIVRIKTLWRHAIHTRLCVRLALVVRHALRIGKMSLLVHCSRCDSWAAILAVRGVLLHGTLGLESWRHTSAHVLVRNRTVGLRRVVGHIGIVVLRRETTASSTIWWKAPVHVCVAHIAVRGLR